MQRKKKEKKNKKDRAKTTVSATRPRSKNTKKNRLLFPAQEYACVRACVSRIIEY
jgi:hypothetical protein